MPEYVEQTWVDGESGGTPLSAARLNHAERGISGALTKEEAAATYAPKSGDGSPAQTLSKVTAPILNRAPQRMPVVTRSPIVSELAQWSNGTDLWGNYAIRHVVQQETSGLSLRFPNYINNAGVETDGANDITVKATVWDDVANTYYPVWFNGRRSAVVEPGPGLWADFLPLPLRVGAVIHVRVMVSVVSAGMKWPLSLLVRHGSEGAVRGAGAVSDLTGSGTITNVAERMYAPSILGLPSGAPKIAVEVAGDSINDGIGDSYPARGWARLALETMGVPHQVIALPSELANTFKQAKVRTRRSPAVEGCQITMMNYGVNDFISTFTSNQVKDSLIQCWRDRATTGRMVLQSTVTPRTTSTDAWATVANQTTSFAAGVEAHRVELNNWLRDGAPLDPATLGKVAIGGTGIRAGHPNHPLGYVLDLADIAESARNSGKWRVDLGQPTTDQVHPSAVIHAAFSTELQAKWSAILAALAARPLI